MYTYIVIQNRKEDVGNEINAIHEQMFGKEFRSQTVTHSYSKQVIIKKQGC